MLDGERPGLPEQAVQEHLAGCSACRAWRERAHLLTRRARLQPAPDVPDLSGRIVAALAADRASVQSRRTAWSLRVALAVLALVQFALTVPVLVFGQDHHAPLHVAHELGSFDVALAVGFLAAAFRPRRAVGMSTVVGVAALVLVGTAAVDLLSGHADVLDEGPHLLTVAGWMLLHALARTTDADGTTPTAQQLPAWVVRWDDRRRRLLGAWVGGQPGSPVRCATGASAPPPPATAAEPVRPAARRAG